LLTVDQHLLDLKTDKVQVQGVKLLSGHRSHDRARVQRTVFPHSQAGVVMLGVVAAVADSGNPTVAHGSLAAILRPHSGGLEVVARTLSHMVDAH
jgi:hypothetical protein